jgi:xylitol oxidase
MARWGVLAPEVPPTLTNWAGNVVLAPAALHRPTTVPDLQVIAARSPRWRVIGSGHSFSPLAATSGDLVSLAALPVDVDIDSTARTATVGGGATYAVLAGQLHARGWALPAMASLPHISVAGAIATGTHGSGDTTRCLAASVRALDTVVPGGDLIRVDREADPADFPGHVVSLGALGAVVRVTLDVEPTYDVRQHVYEGLPAAALVDAFDEVMSSATSVSAFTDLSRDDRGGIAFQVWRKDRVIGAEAGRPTEWLGARIADGPRHPLRGMEPATCTEQLGAPGPWHLRLPHFRPEFTPSNGEELQSEFLLPRPSAPAALAAVLGIAAELAPVVQVCEIRTVAADDLWLSPAQGRDTAGIHVTWMRDTAVVKPAVRRVQEVLEPFGPRPHWGKVFTTDLATVAARYPRMDDMRALVARVDPRGVLGNEVVDPLLRP